MSAAPPGLVLDLEAAVPGWAVRAGLALVVVVCAAVTGGGAVVWTVASCVAVVAAVAPAWPTAALLPALSAAWVLGRPDLLGGAGSAVRLAVLVLAVHVAVRLGALAAHVTWGARVEAAVLRRAVVGVLRVQVVVQSLLVLTFAVRTVTDGATAGALRLVAVPVAVLLVLLVLPRAWVRR